MALSRVEEILKVMLGRESTLPDPPLSRVEELLIDLKNAYETGGREDAQLAARIAEAERMIEEIKMVDEAQNAAIDAKADSATVTEELDNKVDKISGKGLSTNDFTTAEKTKLAGLENYDDSGLRASLATQGTSLSAIDNRLKDVESDMHTLVEHYGIKIDKNNSDTFGRISYLYDAVGFTPAGMNYTTGVFDYGSWKDAFFVKNNYPAMYNRDGSEAYRLSKTDHTKKLYGGNSDIANENFDGNAFSVFDCHIWMKFYEDSNYCYLEVANQKLDEDFVDYPYQREDGATSDKLFYPMYPGYVDSNSRLRSISGVKASSNSTTDEEVTYARNNGDRYSICDWSHYVWFHCLAMLISKNYNSQVAFGNGNMSGGTTAEDFKENGLLNDKGQFYGYNTSSDSVKIFYVENPYANRWQRCLGLYNDNGTYKIKMTPPYTYDETFAGYDTVVSPTVPTSSEYVREFAFSNRFGLLPKSIGGSTTTYVGDYFYTNNAQVNLALVGGRCSGGTRGGSWYVAVDRRPSNRTWSVGASLYLK